MRNIFFDTLFEKMKTDQSLFLVTADMGLGIIEKFEEHYPDRIVNIGIAEQNMIGVAAGLANMGYRPVCYTISNFLVHRCLEQIRNDICLHEYPIMLVGTSTGFDNGKLGPTHQVIDDIAPLKVLPKMRIYSPGSTQGMEVVTQTAFADNAPCYIRLGKGGIDQGAPVTQLNDFVRQNGSDKLIITHSTLLQDVMEKTEADVLMCNKVHPLVADEFPLGALKQYNKITVVEDQSKPSGLYNSLCQFLMEQKVMVALEADTLNMGESYLDIVGDANYLKQQTLAVCQ